jgi:hypothetical protein
MEIYICFDRDYNPMSIVAVFKTEKRAKEFIGINVGTYYEKHEIDE